MKILLILIIVCRFIKHDIENESTSNTSRNSLNIFTPEFTFNAISEFENNKSEILPITEFKSEFKEIKPDDSDVTQLEIDIGSASISNSQISRKRQLIVSGDVIKIESLQFDEDLGFD